MRETLRHKIANSILADYVSGGRIKCGDPLPTTRDLQKHYGVSSGIVLSAIAILEARGVVRTRRGSGCYVVEPPETASPGNNGRGIRCIGLVCNNESADISKSIYSGLDHASRENGYNVILASTRFRYEEEADQVRRLVSLGCEGIVLYPAVRTEAEAATDYLDSELADYPIVVLDLALPRHRRSQVLFDNYRAGYDMTRYLLAEGHKKIAFMDYQCGSTRFLHRSVMDRFAGYRSAMGAANGGGVGKWVLEGRIHEDLTPSIVLHLKRWMCQTDRPTALIALEDGLAAVTISIARELGIGPEDLEVVGFDNLPISRIMRPQITTTNPDFRRAGEIAVEILLGQIRGEISQLTTYYLPAPVIPRPVSRPEFEVVSLAVREPAAVSESLSGRVL